MKVATISCTMKQGEHKYRDLDLLRSPTLLAEAFPLCFSALYCHSLRCFGCSRFVLVVSVPRKRPLQTAVWDPVEHAL